MFWSAGFWPFEGRQLLRLQLLFDAVQIAVFASYFIYKLQELHVSSCPATWTPAYCEAYAGAYVVPAVLTYGVAPLAAVLVVYGALYYALGGPSSDEKGDAEGDGSSSGEAEDDVDQREALLRHRRAGDDDEDGSGKGAGGAVRLLPAHEQRAALAERWLLVTLWSHVFLLGCLAVASAMRLLWPSVVMAVVGGAQDTKAIIRTARQVRKRKNEGGGGGSGANVADACSGASCLSATDRQVLLRAGAGGGRAGLDDGDGHFSSGGGSSAAAGGGGGGGRRTASLIWFLP